ncbi:MAG: universal stress protein [Algisphaera sp.]
MHILIPTAGTEPAQENAAYVVSIAKSLGAALLVLHVRQEADPETDWMATAAAFEEAASGSEVEVDSMQRVAEARDDRAEEIARAIAEAAEEGHCALIVMGASPQAKLSDWVSSRVARESKVPVVVVPRLEEKTPRGETA